MKRLLFLLVLVSVFIFAGCSNVDEQPYEQPDVVSDNNLIDPNDTLDDDMVGDLDADSSLVNYTGLTVEAASDLAEVHNTVLRVVEEDGNMLPTTKDLRIGRINAEVEDGIVVSYTVEGMDLMLEEDEMQVDYIGLTESEATELASLNETMFRVIERDGEPLPATMDYRPGRINATVENGVVVSYMIEGSEEM